MAKVKIFEASSTRELEQQHNAFMETKARKGVGSQFKAVWTGSEIIYIIASWYEETMHPTFKQALDQATIPEHLIPKK